jgi:hypothetical protein
MKFATIFKSVILGLALLLASTAFAATKATLALTNPAVVNGTKLNAGEYKVEWDGTGPNVEVSILQGKNIVAKTTAKLVDLSSPSPYNTAIVSKASDGGTALTGVRFEGKKFALEIGEAMDGAQAGSAK